MRYLLLAFSILGLSVSFAQTPTIGLTKYSYTKHEGYYLYTPLSSKSTYLIDRCGELINSWTSTYQAGVTQMLTPDGYLYRGGSYPPPSFGLGRGGIIEKFDWNGNIVWKCVIADSTQILHHDMQLMPNGNILAIVWEHHNSADAQANGRRPDISAPAVWSEKIVEIKPVNDSFEIVWQWRAWDHLIQDYDSTKPHYGVVADHPELFDINFVGSNAMDWFHINSVDWNPTLDQIVLSAHSTDEIFIIDHSTTITTAAAHSGGNYNKGGDVLYRWGNPASYKHGTASDQRLFKQHHAHWIPSGFAHEGKILIFNNGFNRAGTKFSTIDMIEPPVNSPGKYIRQNGQAFGPTIETTVYKADDAADFYAPNLSGVQSMPDSSYMITSGPQGRFFEIDAQKNVVWEYINPVIASGPMEQGKTPTANGNNVFRCIFYPKNYPGLSGRTLTPKGPIETKPISPSLCELANTRTPEAGRNIRIYPNPAHDVLHVEASANCSVQLMDATGKVIQQGQAGRLNIAHLSPGLYLLSVSQSGNIYQTKFIKD